ncbi:two-component system sensor histidine kinase NtrB [Desulfogranum japonicum]|uniref:two-component system sensor histidine kinase NtrB n=1 Tax=Desulfogranum japonicum TaxID=231447 RepID=UPI00048EC6F7|nr:ATP-binding protein [Desulfogranum japonicum]
MNKNTLNVNGSVHEVSATAHRFTCENELLDSIIRFSPAPLLITDSHGFIKYVNSRFEEILEYSQGDLLGKKVQSHFQKHVSPQLRKEIFRRIGKLQRYQEQVSVTSASGNRLTLEIIVTPVADTQGRLCNIVILANDLTREHEMMQQLHHAQKMEAISKLVSSIAHEFGNPLLGIRFVLRDFQKRLELADSDRQLLIMAESECERIRQLIKDLQQFNRPASGKKVPFDLHEMLLSVITLQRKYLASRKISLDYQFGENKIILVGLMTELQQVFINLILHSCDSICAKGTGGAITLKTWLDGDRVMVMVRNNGREISQEDMVHIFEPFSKTQDDVHGTGLGLSVSYGIIRAYGGDIYVRCHNGNTDFTVALPCEQPEAEK